MSGLGNGLYTPGTAISTTGTGQITTLSSASTSTAGRVNIHGSLILGDKPADNSSSDLEDWEVNEMRKFIKWFVNMHYPEAIEQFLAIRKIERANEEQARLEEQQRWLQREMELRQQAFANISQAEQKSIWDRMKEMAGYRKTEHGDYY